MSDAKLQKKKMLRETMLAKIEDVLKRGTKSDPPAYTLILGAGASYGVVPTAKEMLGFPDAKTKRVHDKSIPIWLSNQLNPEEKLDTDTVRLTCSRNFWSDFYKNNKDIGKCKGIEINKDGLPTPSSISAAYQSVFETSCIGGLDTPEKHRNYMRSVTMTTAGGSTLLNATHFYLASLLSLQKRPGDIGADKKLLYTGRREFARTIFTTNFDPLLQTSLQLFQLLYYMTDRPESLSADALQTDEHPAVHLFYAHGSVHRPYMANTDDQIALLKQQNARDLAAYLGNHGVIVLGYSGWDDCLLEALNQTKSFSNNLYWLARSEDSISPSVKKFINSHPNAYWVEIADGGSFMADLHGRLCPGAPNTEMLYNPIRPLICQLGCVNLTGIKGSYSNLNDSINSTNSIFDQPQDVESVRLQVIELLNNAQKMFLESNPDMRIVEIERQSLLSYSNQNWDTAIDGYSKLIIHKLQLTPFRLAQALRYRGISYFNRGNFNESITDYSDALQINNLPSDQIPLLLINRAISYRAIKKIHESITDCNRAINTPNVTPDSIARARAVLATCFNDQGLYNQSLAELKVALETPGVSTAVRDTVSALQNVITRSSKKSEESVTISDHTPENTGTAPPEKSDQSTVLHKKNSSKKNPGKIILQSRR